MQNQPVFSTNVDLTYGNIARTKVEEFLHAAYPCECPEDSSCPREEAEADEIVRMVEEAYGLR